MPRCPELSKLAVESFTLWLVDLLGVQFYTALFLITCMLQYILADINEKSMNRSREASIVSSC